MKKCQLFDNMKKITYSTNPKNLYKSVQKANDKKPGLTGLNCFKAGYEADHSNRVLTRG